MTLYADIQSLEPGAKVDLFEIDTTVRGGGVVRFHGYLQVGTITWQGVEYSAWPIQAEGFAFSADRPPTPTLRVGNVGGSITALCQAFGDLLGSTLTRRRTLGQYLDAANFGGVNPTADPDEHLPEDIWKIQRRPGEVRETVEFELSSAMDFNNQQLPRRTCQATRCAWLSIGGYRGPQCGYDGPPVAMSDDTPTTDPALDKCGGRVSSCKLRHGENAELPIGSFPSAQRVAL